jgi:DNA-binding transcriptional LysR family regulator
MSPVRPKALEQDLTTRLRMKDLTFLRSIADLKSLSAAANAEGLTQPAASRWLREVEQLFRAHLFTRDRMVGMTPTPLGALVLERARALLADVSTLALEIEAHREGRGGHLRLGVIPYVSARLLERLVSSLFDQHAMTVSLVEAATEPLMESLGLEQLHAVIGRFTPRTPRPGLRQEELFTQKACLLVHEGNSVRRKRQAKLSDFAHLRWVLPPRDSPSWAAIAAAFATAKQPPPATALETASTKLVHAMVQVNADIAAVLPEDIGADLERLGGVVSLPFPAPFHLPPVGLIAHQRQWNQSHMMALRNSLRGLLVAGSK